MEARNPRYLKADKAIRDAFLGLFEKRGIDEISASEVIRAAGVNRSTFYAHYGDKYELLQAVEDDFLKQAEAILVASPAAGLLAGAGGKGPDASTWEDYYSGLIDFLHENKRLFAGLVGRKDSTFMVEFSNVLARVLARNGAASKLGVPVNYEAALLAWGTAGLVEEWARCGFTGDRQKVVRILVGVATTVQSIALG